MKCVNIKQFGGIENLEIQEREIPKPKENEILFKIEGFGINRADTVQRKGNYNPPPGATDILGLEAYGTIDGKNDGKKYCALLGGGGYAQYTTVHKDHIVPFPTNVDAKHGPGFIEVWLTAYQLVKYIGQFKDNQSILIYAGASGVGTSAIQLAKYFAKNSKVFYTVSSKEKMDICQRQVIGATQGFNYKEQKTDEIVEEIKKQTNGKGVDLVLDCVGASNYDLSIKSLAPDATWIQYGLMGGAVVDKFSLGLILGKRLKLQGTTLRSRDDQYKSELIQSFIKDVIPGIESQKLKFFTEKIYDLDWNKNDISPVQEAHKYMESNQSIGKIIINTKN
ncbi:GroES (chaperonin 10)-like protein [Pseudocohnilembus persalinus]|uniref:GroES (Chaperonin 10)-like protein n=1 Tax=Pseudocohnilembus persalinus TaxID=266149 RepID=A0A0V0QXE5_PSEPJ|nr:GroES (chaperonin 10)-like protein [Pseudocohnilembus persalinus]|eukprot:KRX07007.1 GroES (chaperonin 10)-like protein [Pseudocohnilembus persalinus]